MSIIILSLLGETLNVMTLGGMALAVGILVDDATVEIENIHRNLHQRKRLVQAILDGAQQIAVPAFVSTLCICIVFVPVVFISGAAKYLFTPLAMAVVFAMMTSYLLSRTLVPTMVHYLLAGEVEMYGGELDPDDPHAAARARAQGTPRRTASHDPTPIEQCCGMAALGVARRADRLPLIAVGRCVVLAARCGFDAIGWAVVARSAASRCSGVVGDRSRVACCPDRAVQPDLATSTTPSTGSSNSSAAATAGCSRGRWSIAWSIAVGVRACSCVVSCAAVPDDRARLLPRGRRRPDPPARPRPGRHAHRGDARRIFASVEDAIRKHHSRRTRSTRCSTTSASPTAASTCRSATAR